MIVRASLVLQPFADDDSLFEALHEALANDAYESLTVVVAWARPSGLRYLADPLETFKARGGTCDIVLGIDEGGATVEGLDMALNLFDEARVLYDPSGGTFHPKIYLFRGQHEALVIIGSNNFTAGGLYFNYEAAQVIALDLGLTPDMETLTTLEDYIARLVNDDTCLDLTAELIGALAGDPGLHVSRESERTKHPSPGDDSVIGMDEAMAARQLFGSTKHRRKSVKWASKVGSGMSPPGTSPIEFAKGSAELGGSAAPVVARWTKRLTRSDCGQPRDGSHTTGALRFTKAGHPMNQASWFRHVLFSDAQWTEDPTHEGRERVSVRFDVLIHGTKLGTHVLALKYDAQRESGQSNFTTDLKWGSLTPAIEAQDLVGFFVVVERLSDGTFRMKVESDEPEEFVDALSPT